MSECVVRMEIPESCAKCRDMGFFTKCPFYTGNILRRSDRCPIICVLPKNHGRLVDINIVEKKMKDAEELSEFCDEFEFGGRWTVDLSKIPTIVPAEAERSKI